MKKSELSQIIKEEIKKILGEAKQVGILYHYTSPENIEDILKNGIKFSSPQRLLKKELKNIFFCVF